MTKKRRSKKNITFVLHKVYRCWDVLAIGDEQLLKRYAKTNPAYHLIPCSRFGGIPLVVIDTCDTLKEAARWVEEESGKVGKGKNEQI